MNEHLGYVAWTSDGRDWNGPQMLEGTYGHYIWRAATHGGKAYLCGRRKHQFAKTQSREERDPLARITQCVDGAEESPGIGLATRRSR